MRSIALTLALAAVASPAAAQCFDTAFGLPLGAPGSLFGDTVFPIQPIGFAFPIGGTTYTDVHVCDKGYVWLSNGGTPAPGGADFDATVAEFANDSPRVCALWADIQVKSSNNGQVYIKSTPNVCVVTWENAQCYNSSSGIFNMQLQLFPSGQVMALFGPGTTNNSDPTVPTWHVGIAGISPGLGAAIPPASDLLAGGSTTSPLLFEEWIVANTFDMANNSLLMVPNSPTGYAFLTLGAPPANCSQVALFGTGCTQSFDSFYEEWTSGFDLNNTTVSWLRTPTGYVVTTAIPGSFVTPGVGAVNVAPGALDGEQQFTMSSAMPAPGGPTADINVTTKGQIQLANTGGGIDFTPSIGELLNATRTQFSFWHDYDQTDPGSGLILYEEVGTTTYVTWNGVHSYSSSTPSTFQFQLDRTTGNITLVIQTMGGFANPDNGILGYSVAGPSQDPGATDFATLGAAFSVEDNGSAGMSLVNDNLPKIGTTFSLTTMDVPNVAPVGIMFFGTAQVNPGLDLTFLGMPGCFGYTNADLGSATFPVALPQGVGTMLVPIPGSVGLIGVTFSAQSIAFTLATPLNLASSNGAWNTVGN